MKERHFLPTADFTLSALRAIEPGGCVLTEDSGDTWAFRASTLTDVEMLKGLIARLHQQGRTRSDKWW